MENDNRKEEFRERRLRKKKKPTMLVIGILAFFAAFSVAAIIIINYMPSLKNIDFYEYHNLDKNTIQLVLGDELISAPDSPVIRDDAAYIPVGFIKDYVDKYIFWDVETQKLTITTEYKVIRISAGEPEGYINDEPFTLNALVQSIGSTAYMPEALLEELYNIEINYSDIYNIVYIDFTDKDRVFANTRPKNAYLRYAPDKKSPFMGRLSAGTEVAVFEKSAENGEYVKVRTRMGLIGYIKNDDLEDYETIASFSKEETAAGIKEHKPINGKINLVWDQILTAENNSGESARVHHDGLDVLSPTWFKFDRSAYSGDIISIADTGYVNWAHENGYQVWPLISDEEDGDVCAEIFSDQNKRERAVKRILEYVSLYELDGINIDFERVRENDVLYFHQFLRELWPMLRKIGAVLSVDTFVPSEWSMYYNRVEIAKTSDYVCIMTYDENTSGGTSGPNASIGFVEGGVISALREIPKEKLLMGLPYYTRVWIEEEAEGEINYRIRSLGMNFAYRLFTENGAEFTWLPDMGCYYGEYETVEDGKNVKYRTWLEDESSIEEKLKLVIKYDVAGVCAWVRGLEKEEIWGLIKEYLK